VEVEQPGVSATAARNGAAIPDSDTATALLALRRKWSVRKLRPIRNMCSQTPSCVPT